jgi:hypothetical protein
MNKELCIDLIRFLEEIEVVTDEDSCMGMAHVSGRVSEDEYYIICNKLKDALIKLQKTNKEEILVTTSKEDSEILKKAMIILDKNGYTICKK